MLPPSPFPHWTCLNEEIRFVVWNILRFLRKLNLGWGVINRKVASDPSRSEHIRHRAEDFQHPRIILFLARTVEDNNICQEQMTEVKENTLSVSPYSKTSVTFVAWEWKYFMLDLLLISWKLGHGYNKQEICERIHSSGTRYPKFEIIYFALILAIF